MDKRIYDFNELSDSKLVYQKKLPIFLTALLLILFSLIVGAVAWACLVDKTDMVITQGLVVTAGTTINVSKVTAPIRTANFKEGDVVEKGDVILYLDDDIIDLKLATSKNQVENMENFISLYMRAEAESMAQENTFDKTNSDEIMLYNILEQQRLQIKQYSAMPDNESAIQSIITQTVNTLYSQRVNYESELVNAKAQLVSYEVEYRSYSVIAEVSGVLHYKIDYSESSYVQQGNVIFSIAPSEAMYVIETVITPDQRVNLTIGDSVSVVVSGLPQNEYGKIEGELIEISADLLNFENQSGYTAKIKIDKNYLTDSKGNNVVLMNGNITENRIMYDSMSYMKYLLECLGVKI